MFKSMPQHHTPHIFISSECIGYFFGCHFMFIKNDKNINAMWCQIMYSSATDINRVGPLFIACEYFTYHNQCENGNLPHQLLASVAVITYNKIVLEESYSLVTHFFQEHIINQVKEKNLFYIYDIVKFSHCHCSIMIHVMHHETFAEIFHESPLPILVRKL